MSITSGNGWVAVFQRTDPFNEITFTSHKVPIVVWKEQCIDNNDTVVGYVVEDRDGNDLPFPVPAPNVFGFVRYAKIDREEKI